MTGVGAQSVFAAFMSFAALIRCDAQHDTTRYRQRVIGVFDNTSGAPVADVDVIDVLAGNSVRTTTTGTASLAFLPDGGALVRIRKLGFQQQTMMIGISPTDTMPMTIVLTRVTELPAVATVDSGPRYISPNLRAFEDRRRKSATGHFVPEAQIRKDESRGMDLGSSLIAHIPTIPIRMGRQGAALLGPSPHCGSGGGPDVYLDGVRLAHPSAPPRRGAAGTASLPADLSEFQLGNLAGAEYYPTTSGAPAEFGGTSTSCGVLLLWSRQ
ncbi:MAG: hypothetical protein JWM95_3170 [Gemmatimonadetes bacterium]|nr:hypothetical protein [Gemmatimonadota bacterium]